MKPVSPTQRLGFSFLRGELPPPSPYRPRVPLEANTVSPRALVLACRQLGRMASVSDARSATRCGTKGSGHGDLDMFFDQLDLQDEVFDDLEINEDDPEILERTRWLALARVHTEKSFSQAAFFREMRAAWNPAQEIRFRPVGPNLFVVQASCLGDWERIIQQGPWIFRFWAVLLQLYDGFTPAEEVEFLHMPIWLQIHKIPDVYCKKEMVEKLLRNSGKILEMRLNGNSRGDYIRVRVQHDVTKPLTKFVSIVRAKERKIYLVRYEKLARFCKFCGLVGHEFKECGTGLHETKDLKFGDWLYADRINRNRVERDAGSWKNTSGARGSTQEKGGRGGAVLEQGKDGLDGCDDDLKDTGSSPRKEDSVEHMELDWMSRKRLNLGDAAKVGNENLSGQAVLALTDGKGEDLKDDSPSSSTSSKRAKKDNIDNDKNLSAGSLEGRRREQ